MKWSQIRQIASSAEEACASVVADSPNLASLETLYEALSPVTDPTFSPDDDHSGYLRGRTNQARALAQVLRRAIEQNRPLVGQDRAAAQVIVRGARNLRAVLNDIVEHTG